MMYLCNHKKCERRMNDIIITAIISALSSGGLTALVTLKSSKKKANAEADGIIGDNYKDVIEMLKSNLVEQDQKIDAMGIKIEILRDQVQNLKEIIMSSFRCPHLAANPDAECPVQKAMDDSKKGGEA